MPLHTVFVYGSLKRGFSNHHVLAGAKFLGAGVTRPAFAMVDLGRYPGVVRGTRAVSGEVYAVPDRVMRRLDQLEANGRIYLREQVQIDMAAGPVQAWMYLYLVARGREKPVPPQGGALTWRETPALRE